MKTFIIHFYEPDQTGKLEFIAKTIATGENDVEAAALARKKLSTKYPGVEKNWWMAGGHYGSPE